jgi:hypothetical protein
LASSEDAGTSRARDSAISDGTTSDEAFSQFEDLFDFGMTDDRFAGFGVEHSRHRFFYLVN